MSNLVQIRKQRPKVDLVNTRRITNAHKSSHEVENPASHIGAAVTEKDVDCFGTTAQKLSDLHFTRYVFHHRLVAEENHYTRKATLTPNVQAERPAATNARKKKPRVGGSARAPGWASGPEVA